MGLLTQQLTGLTLLILCRLCFGLIPLGIDPQPPTLTCVELLVALFLSLAGGVLLATTFIHLIPQVRLALRLSLPHHALPVTELLVVAGFFFTFFLDEALVSFRSGSKKVHPEEEPDPDPGPEEAIESPKSVKSETKSKSSSSSIEGPTGLPVAPRVALLSLQALAQGAALGLAQSVGEVWFVVTSSTVHGSASGLDLSIRLLIAECSPGVVVLITIFLALLAVTGLVAVVLLREFIDEGLTALVRGLAAGSVLYVAVYEVLSREVRHRGMGLLAYFVAVMGFLMMLVLQLWGLHEPNFEDELLTNCGQKATTEEPEYNYAEDGNS